MLYKAEWLKCVKIYPYDMLGWIYLEMKVMIIRIIYIKIYYYVSVVMGYNENKMIIKICKGIPL